MNNDTPLTDDEIAILRGHGYEPRGSGIEAGLLFDHFNKDGKLIRSTRSEWRLMIAGFQRPPTEDVAAFGEGAWVYCKQHCRPHQTGWCSVAARDKVGLGVTTAKEAVEKCRAWGFDLYADLGEMTWTLRS